LKQGDYNSNKRFKPSFKAITIIGIAIVVLTGIMAYNESGKGKSELKSNPFMMHIHSNLSIMMDNKSIMIPSQIGIDKPLWNDHSLDSYGMPGMPMPGGSMPGMAPLHTHDNQGLIHTESLVNRDYTLGEFLNIWGYLDINNKIVNMTIDGKPNSNGNFTNHILRDGEQINLDIT